MNNVLIENVEGYVYLRATKNTTASRKRTRTEIQRSIMAGWAVYANTVIFPESIFCLPEETDVRLMCAASYVIMVQIHGH